MKTHTNHKVERCFSFSNGKVTTPDGFSIPTVEMTNHRTSGKMRCLVITPSDTGTPDGFVLLSEVAAFFGKTESAIHLLVKKQLKIEYSNHLDKFPRVIAECDSESATYGDSVCQRVKMMSINGAGYVRVRMCVSLTKVVREIIPKLRSNGIDVNILLSKAEYLSWGEKALLAEIAKTNAEIKRIKPSVSLRSVFNISSEVHPGDAGTVIAARESIQKMFVRFAGLIKEREFGGKRCLKTKVARVNLDILRCVNMLDICMFGDNARNLIYHRLSMDDPFFGCTTFSGQAVPGLNDLRNAQMFLTPKELIESAPILERIVSILEVRLNNSDGTLRKAHGIKDWVEFVIDITVQAYSEHGKPISKSSIREGLALDWDKEKFGCSVDQSRDLWLDRNCGGRPNFKILRRYIKANGPGKITLREAMEKLN